MLFFDNRNAIRQTALLVGVCLASAPFACGQDASPSQDAPPSVQSPQGQQGSPSRDQSRGEDELESRRGLEPVGTPRSSGSIAGPGQIGPKEIGQAIVDLASDSYLRRKRATNELMQIGGEAVDPLVEQLETGDLETTERVLSILQEIAIRSPISLLLKNSVSNNKGDSDNAWLQLERISTLGGSRGTRAKLAVKEVRDVRRAQAIEILGQNGVFIGMTDFIIGAREQIKRIVEIDETFEGDWRLMDLLRWVDEVEFARIKGTAIRSEVLSGIIRMPDLQTLAIMQGELSVEELKTLGGIDELRNLELRYVPMTAELVDQLSTLPIRVSLTLNGTAAPIDRVEALRKTVPGLTIVLKQGGFLGVRCYDNFNECSINEVIRGKAAEQAGLRQGDVITEADGKPVKQFKDLQDAINAHIPGDTIEIRYRRGAVELVTKARLGKLDDH